MGRPVLLYDGECRFCRFSARAIAALDRRRRLAFLPFADEAAEPFLAAIPQDERYSSWHLAWNGGERASGGGAVAHLLTALGFERLARAAARQEPVIERLYEWVAAHRDRLARIVPDGPGPRRMP